MSNQGTVDRLSKDREKTYRKLGEFGSSIVGRNLHNYPDPRRVLWPSSAIGALRYIERAKSVVVVTDGLSDPWDPEMHENAPLGTLGFELAIEVPKSQLKDFSEQAVLTSWMPTALIAVTDWIVAERFDLLGVVYKFDCASVAIPPVGGLDEFVREDGMMRGLVGVPIIGDLGTQITLATEDSGAEIALLTLKLLTTDEADRMLSSPMQVTTDMVNAFLQRGDRHLTWTGRPSILAEPEFAQPQLDWFVT